jgi:hypothetical protein
MLNVVKYCSSARPDLGCATQPMSDPIQAGQEAWVRLKAHQTWSDWKVLGTAVAGGRAEAMREARTNRPAGRRYNESFCVWLTANKFADIGKTTRARLLQCMEKIDAIEAWLKKLEIDKRLKLNHPTTVLSAWKRSTAAPKPKTEKPFPDWVAAWRQTPDDGKTSGLARISFNEFLAVMPASWRAEMMQRVARLDGGKGGKPDPKISRLVQTALSHMAAASAPETSEIVAKSQEKAAVATLIAIHRVLHGLGRDLHDVEIVLTSAKSSKQRRAS